MSNKKEITRDDYYRIVDEARYEGIRCVLSLIDAMAKGGDLEKIPEIPHDMELQREMYKKYHMTLWKKDLTYRVNAFCPKCGEEHAYFDIQITEEEQKIVEDFYEDKKNVSSFYLLLAREAPLRVTKEFVCPCCRAEFKATVPIIRECYLGRKVGVMINDDNVMSAW